MPHRDCLQAVDLYTLYSKFVPPVVPRPEADVTTVTNAAAGTAAAEPDGFALYSRCAAE